MFLNVSEWEEFPFTNQLYLYVKTNINLSIKIIIISMMLLFLGVSCNDDIEFAPTSSDTISYLVSMGYERINSRSSNRCSLIKNLNVIESQATDNHASLYLHSIIKDWNDSPCDLLTNVSRGGLIAESNFYNSFSLSAFVYNDAITEINKPNFFLNDCVENVGGIWSNNRFWPSNPCKMIFYGFAPYNSSSLSLNFPEIYYETPIDFNDQIDLLLCKSDEISVLNNSVNSSVPLLFQHGLCSIQFEIDLNNFEEGTIKSITLRNVESSGHINLDNIASGWSLSGICNNYNLSNINFSTSGGNSSIFEITEAFIMLPQSFTEDDNAYIDLEFEDNITKSTYTISFSLANQRWGMGEKILYRLSTNENLIQTTFEIYDIESEATYTIDNFQKFFEINRDGIDKEFLIRSFADIVTKTDSVRIAMPPSIDVPNADWCVFQQDNSIDGVDNNKGIYGYRLFVNEQPGESDEILDSHDKNLRVTPVSGIYNLANTSKPNNYDINDVDCYTANCYLINAPGSYCIPLVYGNAISNGKDNKLAYTTQKNTVGNTYTTNKTLSNHKDLIKSPRIQDNEILPDGVKLIWMDKPNLISNLI